AEDVDERVGGPRDGREGAWLAQLGGTGGAAGAVDLRAVVVDDGQVGHVALDGDVARAAASGGSGAAGRAGASGGSRRPGAARDDGDVGGVVHRHVALVVDGGVREAREDDAHAQRASGARGRAVAVDVQGVEGQRDGRVGGRGLGRDAHVGRELHVARDEVRARAVVLQPQHGGAVEGREVDPRRRGGLAAGGVRDVRGDAQDRTGRDVRGEEARRRGRGDGEGAQRRRGGAQGGDVHDGRGDDGAQ